jgi:hypothetical protein
MDLTAVAKLLMDTDKEVHFSIDRTISKWLEEGEDEFMHTDTAPFSKRDNGSIQGKFCATDGAFICSPGSHLLTEEVARLYPAIYPKTKKTAKKFGLSKTAEDPLHIIDNSVRVIVPAGCLILWHDNLFHGVAKNETGRVQWGCYVGWTNNIERKDYHKSGKDQVQDRYDSWRYGVRPIAHPSCDPTWLYPYRFMNMHQILGSFIRDKMDTSNPQYNFSNRLTASGKSVPHLQENADPKYKAYPLSEEGRAMLVGKHNVAKFEWDF